MSYKIEVLTVGGGESWDGNELRFATEKEAEVYAMDLSMRWSAVTDWRIAESDDPVTHSLTPHRHPERMWVRAPVEARKRDYTNDAP